jgi:hypothetical protein
MGSRNGGRPVILSARRGFEPTRWQDQTLATAYRLVFAQSQIEPRTGQRVDWRRGVSTVDSDQGLSQGEVNVHEPIETSTGDLWPSLVGAAVAGAYHR